jgi:ATP-dependent Clp protease protease subunit
MKYSKYGVQPFRMDDEPAEEKEDKPQTDPGMLMKKLEKYFFETRTVQLWGPVDDRSAKDIINKFFLLDMDQPGKEIRFLINSPGGVVTSGMAIYDVMRMMKSPVSTVCIGLAASMGSILLSGGAKGRRFIYPHGEVMIHQPSLGGYIQGVSVDLEIQAKQTKRVKEIGAKILAENCGKKFDQIMKDFDRDYWMDAKESVEYGIVDGVSTELYA